MSVMLVVTSYGSNMDEFPVECLRIKVMDIFKGRKVKWKPIMQLDMVTIAFFTRIGA
jgi:hypothetical protein